MTREEKYMKEAIKQAKKAYAIGEVPIGCVIVYQDKIVGRGYNRRITDKNTLSHAELNAIKKASKVMGDWRLDDCEMYITLEPCQMCSGAIVQSRIKKVYIGCMNPKAGCAGSILNLLQVPQFNHQVEMEKGILEEECSQTFAGFHIFPAVFYRIVVTIQNKTGGISMKHIVLTGGGTAGHVTPNIALIPRLKELGYEISYIGSYDGIEKKLIEEMNIPYYGISSGKLRRYFDLKNFTDPFRVLKGFGEAKKLLKQLKPDVVFSKGGFVTVPVVIAAGRRKIPTIIHESDMTPGLANKICIPSATKVCCNFPETVKSLPADKAVLTGTPIRQELLNGSKEAAREFCGFTDDKPVLMVIGGSLGAASVNENIRKILPELLKEFQVIHLCGKGKMDESLKDTKGYVQYEYIKQELADLFALSDIVISRAGANAICELNALKKPNLLIPLSANASRGDQILNARSFERQGFSMVLEEEEITESTLLNAIRELYQNRESYVHAMSESSHMNSIEKITGLIEDCVNKQ